MAFEKAFTSKPSERSDCFGSVARRAAQANRDAETLREPVPSAFSGGRGVLNLRPAPPTTPARLEEELVLRRLRKRLRNGRRRGAAGLGPIRPKYRTVARVLVLHGFFDAPSSGSSSSTT